MRDPFGSPSSLPFSSSSSLPAPAGAGVCVLLLWLLLLSTSSAIGWSLEGLAASCPSPSVRPLVGWVPKDAATVRQLTTRAARAIRAEAAHPRHLCHAPPARSLIHARTGLSCRQVLSGDGGDSSEGVAPGEAILSGMGSPRLRCSRRVRVLQQHLCNFFLVYIAFSFIMHSHIRYHWICHVTPLSRHLPIAVPLPLPFPFRPRFPFSTSLSFSRA